MLIVVDHPLVKVHIAILRHKDTGVDQFRHTLTAISRLIAYPVLEELEVLAIEVPTPLAMAQGFRLAKEPILVPVLRAGLGMVEGFRDVIPSAVVSHLGMYRDHATLKPVRYYTNFPDHKGDHPFLLLDPMLATGGSAVDALNYLKEKGARNIRLVSVIAAPEGVQQVESLHSDVPIYTAQLDDHLNENGYIIPGLGDAGDRQFGTL
ncbi:MAG: uracil phosphoribosyltransferase [Sulfobacillus benefaciens]|uniref:Uracil phosphoribosyltransferase n=1 Tax=Sulfobacillus benefaciens TaxID=453960 RepID=A0A2T2XIJ2_9FIRM|nr:MAG: uracil phosphoribosyltransferase [Sulfobacillus benefaciens]